MNRLLNLGLNQLDSFDVRDFFIELNDKFQLFVRDKNDDEFLCFETNDQKLAYEARLGACRILHGDSHYSTELEQDIFWNKMFSDDQKYDASNCSPFQSNKIFPKKYAFSFGAIKSDKDRPKKSNVFQFGQNRLKNKFGFGQNKTKFNFGQNKTSDLFNKIMKVPDENMTTTLPRGKCLIISSDDSDI